MPPATWTTRAPLITARSPITLPSKPQKVSTASSEVGSPTRAASLIAAGARSNGRVHSSSHRA